MATLTPINTDKAPAAIGPYSQAMAVNGMLFVSGQIPVNPATQELQLGPVKEQAALVLDNLRAVLEAGGSDMNHVVKTTVFLKDMNDFAAVNEVYAEKFGDARPARAAVQVSRLPKDVSVEIECVAVVSKL
ncbi:uncharacterized protein MONBRDRAFT_35357 [Monosiga brevicollis MX1]|uniref:Uncharacterized protein n=1 Tax=Monosiga brevicollis TaxID=81824 RepID=A9UYR5_MONBE|nr:uncharacterized protein MONBRDRAFT_35357 [Monosiga brevicollis MX1]EDQ89508.1 predicted protein [Monosiga brevicollis MX1]|eukprot:XP_001745537.1 hypothetical protein [Monosiga brevicollis MX1]